MSSRTPVRALHRWLIATLAVAIGLPQVSVVLAGNYRVGAVGGVVILADGVVQNAEVDQRHALAKRRRDVFTKPTGDLNRPVEIRKISLRALEQACQRALREDSGQLPDEVKYLGGLQRIQYVFIYPEQNDIVLAGPAEGWTIDDFGNVVGVTTGRPVLQLDDLLVALRTVSSAKDGGISCSINPTPEGHRALNELLARQKNSGTRVNVPKLEEAMKEAYGNQLISLSGVDPTSHFARVLVAADYRMKRLAMKLDRAPIRGLPSYVEMLKKDSKKTDNVNPRWWLACNYEPVLKSDDALAWELRGQGVKCLTEDDVIGADGQATRTGKTSPTAQKWADLMTEKYDELAAKEVVFGQLRNVMDLCVVAAMIDQHELCAKAGCELPVLTGSRGELKPVYWYAPQKVPPQCSFLRTKVGWVVTASGGVQIESFRFANRVETNNAVKRIRNQATKPNGDSWWWN